MLKYKLTLIVWLFLIMGTAYAQKGQDFQKQFLNAKSLFREAKYNLAIEAFKPLIALDNENPFSAYSSFYYAVASYREGYAAVAKNMFLQIKRVHPKWSKLDEVNFWLGTLYLENGSYEQAFEVLSQVKSKKLKNQIANNKSYFLNQVGDLDSLKILYVKYPEDSQLGEVLAKRIAGQSLQAQDRELVNELINKFNLNKDEFNIISPTETIYKDTYRVAVLLPFRVDKLEADLSKPIINQFVIDLYHGIRMAADTLKQQGVDIELVTYDTRRDTTMIKDILEKEELRSMDLIIGPLYSDLIPFVNEFSFKNKINVINPIHTSASVIENNPFSFLYNSTSAVVGQRAAEFALKNVREKPGVIFYGESVEDSILAYAYKQKMEMEQFDIILTQKVPEEDNRVIQETLLLSSGRLKEAATAGAREKYTIGLDSISHIFVASENNLISSKVMSVVETRGDSIVVIGSSKWLNASGINYDAYFKLGAILYAPNYYPKDAEAYQTFRKEYVAKHRALPGEWAERGYDLMTFIGNSLYKYGKYFQVEWQEGLPSNSYLRVGYDYRNSNDNQYVPMLSFDIDGIQVIYDNDSK